MRPARIISTRTIVALQLTLVALLLMLPTVALAQDAGEPEMMEDPIEAMEPEVEVAEPAEVVEPVAPAADDVIAQGNAIPEAQGVADPGASGGTGTADEGAAFAPSSPVASGSGQLPFTGLDSGRIMQLFLVGSVLLAGGVTAIAWASARTETA